MKVRIKGYFSLFKPKKHINFLVIAFLCFLKGFLKGLFLVCNQKKKKKNKEDYLNGSK